MQALTCVAGPASAFELLHRRLLAGRSAWTLALCRMRRRPLAGAAACSSERASCSTCTAVSAIRHQLV